MTRFAYTLSRREPPRIGLIVLQSDETLEGDFRRLVPDSVRLFVSRVPSAREVTPETLGAMEGHLSAAAALFPRDMRLDAVGYGCTSGTAEIGRARVAELVLAGTGAGAVSEPVSALTAACRALGAGRLAILSPYIESVSARLRGEIAAEGIETPVFGSFNEPAEARVARISAGSVMAAARKLVTGTDVDALFLSCTNLRTLGVIARLEAELGIPVLSSNQVLAWHLLGLAGAKPRRGGRGRLFSCALPPSTGGPAPG